MERLSHKAAFGDRDVGHRAGRADPIQALTTASPTGEVFDSTGIIGHLNQTKFLPNGTHLIDDSINAGNNIPQERSAPQVLEREGRTGGPSAGEP